MANLLKVSNAGANAEADALGALLNSGWIRIYSLARPTTADDVFNQNAACVLLASLRFAAGAFGPAVAGVITAAAIVSDSAADATGTATWFRCQKSGGVDVTDNVYDGEIGTVGSDMNLNSVAIQINAQVSVSALTYTRPKS